MKIEAINSVELNIKGENHCYMMTLPVGAPIQEALQVVEMYKEMVENLYKKHINDSKEEVASKVEEEISEGKEE